MGFVKTPEEVKRIEAVMKRPRFVGAEMLMIDFLTRRRSWPRFCRRGWSLWRSRW